MKVLTASFYSPVISYLGEHIHAHGVASRGHESDEQKSTGDTDVKPGEPSKATG